MFKSELFLRLFGAFLRHFLGFAGSILVAKGFLSEEAAGSLASEEVVGGIIMLVSIGLSVVDKVKQPAPPPASYNPPPVQQMPMENHSEWARPQIDARESKRLYTQPRQYKQ